MLDLIGQFRAELARLQRETECTGDCAICAIKSSELLEAECDAWEARLQGGERPGLTDLSRLLSLGRRVLADMGAEAEGGPDGRPN